MFGQEIHIETSSITQHKQLYRRGECIGSGGFAKCYMMQNQQTRYKIAAKVINRCQMKSKSGRNKVFQQIQIHKTLNHKNILKFYEMIEHDKQTYLLMEYCQNNSLKQLVKSRSRITQFQARYYLHQILNGIQYLHQNGIVHRDIKLGNIFINSHMHLKIGDFGLSTKLKHHKQKKYTLCGTPNYIAPETLNETGHSFEVDIWAVGVILYAFLFGRPPFQSSSVQNTYKKIKINQYQFPKQIPISTAAKDLIKNLLQQNPKLRISIDKIKLHQFMSQQLHKIPESIPPYTISLPPQNNFLKQYWVQTSTKLNMMPKRIYNDDRNWRNRQSTTIMYSSDKDLKDIIKLSRVKSLDKNNQITKLFEHTQRSNSKLNQGFLNGNMSHTSTRLRLKSNSPQIFPNPMQNSPVIDHLLTQRSPRRYEDDGTEVICYYDMSSKYGIGYILSNGNLGVAFNDGSSLTEFINGTYLYYKNDEETRMKIVSDILSKKEEIFKLCKEKLVQYKNTNVHIPYYSESVVKKWLRFKTYFVLKLSNSIFQFFQDCDSITLKGYKWVKWRISDEEGQSIITAKNSNPTIQFKIDDVRDFLKQYSQKSKRK